MAKPLRSTERSRARLEMLVTPAERDELRRVADENGVSVAALMREAIDEFVSDYRERTVFRRTPLQSSGMATTGT